MMPLLAMVVSIALGATPDGNGRPVPVSGPSKIAAVMANGGAAVAAADIKAGRPVILGYGKRPLSARGLNGDGFVGVDKATGLKLLVIAGCMVSDELVAEADAYNAAIREWHVKQKTN